MTALAVAPAAAHAAPTQESLFMDDNRLMYRGDRVSDATLEQLVQLGVDRVRLSVVWRNLAPATRPAGFDGIDPGDYPATRFDALDHVVRVARRVGIEVLFNVVGPAPSWASGKRLRNDPRPADGEIKPSPAQYARFVEMLGRRYGGEYKDENQGEAALPRVAAWSIWNEPNLGQLLAPQWQRNRRTRRWEAVAPHHYRRLYRAATDGLAKSGHGDDILLIGETAPLGNKPRTVRTHMKPLVFLRELFCLQTNLKPFSARTARRRGCDFATRGPLKVSGYAHHPYSVTAPPGTVSKDPDTAILGDSQRLKRVLDAAARARLLSAGVPLWYTEHGYQTKPPDPIRGVSLDEQAAWNSQAEQITRADPRVAAHSQFLLRDDEPIGSFPASDPRYWGTYQTGLEFADGTAKPALNAYRLPLTAAGTTLWGLVRPLGPGEPQTIAVQFRSGPDGGWENVRELQVSDANGIWTLDVGAGARGGQYRFVWPVVPPPPRGILDPLSPPPPPPAPFVSEPVRIGAP